MRRLLRDIAEGRALGDVTTLRDPAVVDMLGQAIATAPKRISCAAGDERSPAASLLGRARAVSDTTPFGRSAPAAVLVPLVV